MSLHPVPRQHHATPQRSTENPFFHRRELRETEVHWATWKKRGVVLASLLVVVYLLFFSGLFAVTEIVISGNEQISNQRITSLIEDEWEEPILGVLPKNNILFLSTRGIRERVNQQFLLKELLIERNFFPHRIVLSLKERLPGLMFEYGQAVWITDEEGIVLGVKDEVASGVYPVVNVDASNTTLEFDKGSNAVSSDVSGLILTIFEDLPDTVGLHPARALLLETNCQSDVLVPTPDPTPRTDGEGESEVPALEPGTNDLANANSSPVSVPKQVTLEELKREQTEKEISECESANLSQDVEITLTEGYSVRFTTRLPIEKQFEYLQSFLESVDGKRIATQGPAYIDVRYGNKIYYK